MMNTQAPWWMVPSLGALSLVIFAGTVIASCFIGDDTLRTQMFTAASSLGLMAASYYFGSSAGSQKKDDVLARANQATLSQAPAKD